MTTLEIKTKSEGDALQSMIAAYEVELVALDAFGCCISLVEMPRFPIRSLRTTVVVSMG
ncbi:MAG: hypothetical protein P1U90_09290 [Akkermansiaceae bacterium]|nr:hypothetical protein [Akkermansiaceae bacterium]